MQDASVHRDSSARHAGQGGRRAGQGRTLASRYQFGFLGRYLRPVVGEIRVRQGLRQQEIARDVGLPPHALSEYLNCRAHPSEERQEVLTKLGCDLGRVRRAILADKLAYWMAKLDLDAEDLITAARQVHDEAVRPDRFSEVRLIGQAADR